MGLPKRSGLALASMAVVVLGLAGRAAAHDPGTTVIEVQADEAGIEAKIEIPIDELSSALGLEIPITLLLRSNVGGSHRLRWASSRCPSGRSKY